MTTDELIAMGKDLLEFGRTWLTEHGDLYQQFQLVKSDGSMEVMVTTGSVTNSAESKYKLSQLIRARVKQGDVVAVAMLSDVFMSRDGTLETEKARDGLGLTLEEGARAGLGYTVQEHVLVLLESPILCWGAAREYRRQGKVIEWVGEVREMPQDMQTSGNFAGYWPPVGGTKQ